MSGTGQILIAVERWNPAGGGRERYAAELGAALSRRGWSVSVACATAQAPAAHPLESHATVAGLRAAVGRWRDGHPGGAAVGLFPLPEASHVQLHSGLLACAADAERNAFGIGLRRLLFKPAGALNRRRRGRARDESATCRSRTAALMTFSRHDAEALARIHHVDPAQVTVARPGVDLRRFVPAAEAPSGAPHRPLRIIFAGHNFRLKGLARVLDAIARARGPLTLTVAGGGARLPFAIRARLRGLTDRVQFCGNLSQDELAARFRMSDVLLHPAYYDPFPRAVVEAMACGCVPIVARQCGVSEVLSDGVDGFVAAGPGAVDEMARWLDALQHPELRAAMRDAAIQRARGLDFDSHTDVVASWLGQRPEATAGSPGAGHRTVPAGQVVDLLRVSHDPIRVAAYAAEMRRGVEFPPIAVLRCRRWYLVADGHKRLTALRALHAREITVTVWTTRQWLADQRRQAAAHARKWREIARLSFTNPPQAGRLVLSTLNHWWRVARSLALWVRAGRG